jgi:hypothetical protein
MSIAIVKLSDSNLPIFRKLMKVLNARISVVKNQEEYEKKIMLKLIEESEESENIPEEVIRKDFKKYGIDL